MHPAAKLLIGALFAGAVWLVTCVLAGCYVADILGWSALILFVLASVRV